MEEIPSPRRGRGSFFLGPGLPGGCEPSHLLRLIKTLLVGCSTWAFRVVLGGMKTQPIQLTQPERADLQRRAESRAGRAHDARIGRVLLLLADGRTYREIAERVDCSEPLLAKWKKRFVQMALPGSTPAMMADPSRSSPPRWKRGLSIGPARSPRRIHASEHRASGQELGHSSRDVPSDVEKAWDSTPWDRTLHGVRRSKPWIAKTRFRPSRPVGPNDTRSSTSAAVRFP